MSDLPEISNDAIEYAAAAVYEAEWEGSYSTASQIEQALAQDIAHAALDAFLEYRDKDGHPAVELFHRPQVPEVQR
jgi:hypothetical protein